MISLDIKINGHVESKNVASPPPIICIWYDDGEG